MIQRTKVRQFALDHAAKSGRPFKRVSKEFLDGVEADVRLMVIKKMQTRPSKMTLK